MCVSPGGAQEQPVGRDDRGGWQLLLCGTLGASVSGGCGDQPLSEGTDGVCL